MNIEDGWIPILPWHGGNRRRLPHSPIWRVIAASKTTMTEKDKASETVPISSLSTFSLQRWRKGWWNLQINKRRNSVFFFLWYINRRHKIISLFGPPVDWFTFSIFFPSPNSKVMFPRLVNPDGDIQIHGGRGAATSDLTHRGDPCLVLTSDPKPRLRWTADLHERFVDAVTQLGGASSQYSFFCTSISRFFALVMFWLSLWSR